MHYYGHSGGNYAHKEWFSDVILNVSHRHMFLDLISTKKSFKVIILYMYLDIVKSKTLIKYLIIPTP